MYRIHAGAHIGKKGASNPLEMELEILWAAMWGRDSNPSPMLECNFLSLPPPKYIHVFFS